MKTKSKIKYTIPGSIQKFNCMGQTANEYLNHIHIPVPVSV